MLLGSCVRPRNGALGGPVQCRTSWGGVSELDCQIFVVGFPRALLWACDIHCGGCVLSLFVLCCGHILLLLGQFLCLYFDDLRHHLGEPYGHVFRQRANERHRDCVKTWSMRSSCWRIRRKMEMARYRIL